MARILVGTLILLVGLLVYGRIDRRPASPGPAAPATSVMAVAVDSPALNRRSTAATVIRPSEGTPSMDLLARLEGRRRLARAAGTTYFDSLFTETDSVVRRWPDRQGLVFVVAIPPSDSAEYDTPLRDVLQRALSAWEAAGLGIRFTLSPDTTGATILAFSTRYLGEDRAGQTDIQWTRDGSIHSAAITLSRRDADGRVLPPSILHAVAMHEVGHALGLSHSPSADDVMFWKTKTGTLSRRDQATLRLLYELPIGTIREVVQ